MGTHLGHIWIPESRIWTCRAWGWWLQLEIVGVVFEVFLASLLLPVIPKLTLGESSTQSRSPELKSVGACAGQSGVSMALCQKIQAKFGECKEMMLQNRIPFQGMFLQLFVLESSCSWYGSKPCWSAGVLEEEIGRDQGFWSKMFVCSQLQPWI